MKAILVFLFAVVMVVGHVSGASDAVSCFFVNGQRMCQRQSDPNSNSASSGSMVYGNNGQLYTDTRQFPNFMPLPMRKYAAFTNFVFYMIAF